MSNVTFEELNIDPDVLKAVTEMGFTQPTEIQEKAIPILGKTNKDFIGQAQTGTGKTAAFVIPILEKIDYESKAVQALILAPTRELAMQVENEIHKLGKHTEARSTCIYGGTGYEKQLRSLKKDFPQIVVGTPGRVMDMIKRRALVLDNASFCVLDEADEMLNMGFFEDVQKILSSFKKERQLIMFSATMPQAIIKLIKKSFNEYEMVKVEKKSVSNDNIEQKYFIVKPRYFKESLGRIMDANADMYGIVFCRTRVETKEVGDHLKKQGYNVEVLNGDMGQVERERAMKRFKDKKATIMVCTDVAARGIDVNNLTHVINYGLPQDNESYVHRIGRTGRAGQTGKAFTIVGPSAAFAIRKIERHINKSIELGKLPSLALLKRKKIEDELSKAERIIEALKVQGDDFKTDESFSLFEDKLKDLAHDQLIKLMFTWKFDAKSLKQNGVEDIEDTASGGSPGRGRSRARGRASGARSRRGGGSASAGGRRGAGGGGGSSRNRSDGKKTTGGGKKKSSLRGGAGRRSSRA